MSGIDHVNQLVQKDLLQPTGSVLLDQIYSHVNVKAVVDTKTILEEAKVVWKDAREVENGEAAEALLLRKEDAQMVSVLIVHPIQEPISNHLPLDRQSPRSPRFGDRMRKSRRASHQNPTHRSGKDGTGNTHRRS